MNRSASAFSAALAAVLLCLGLTTTSADAAEAKVGLGTATPFAVLAGRTVTNTGPSVINGDLGLSSGSAVTGFPPGQVNGTQHVTDAVARQAQDDLTTAYNDAAGRGPAVDKTDQDLGGQTLVGGAYRASTAMALTGTVTLDAQGNPQTIFVFQAGSTLTTASSSRVRLIGGAQACNVFWQVGSSATLGTSTQFVGTIMALTSATLKTNARLQGRVLARNGAVTLDTNVITRPGCAAAPTTPPTSAPPTNNGGGGSGGGGFIPIGRPDTGAHQIDDSGAIQVWLTAAAVLLSVALVASIGSRRRSTWLARQR